MSNRRFIVFFLVGIALLGALLAALSWRARAVATGNTRATLCTFAPETVDGLDIVHDGTNLVRLARGEADGAWRLTAPQPAPAEAAAVARLVDALTLLPLGDMRTAAELAALGEDFADFGLAEPVRTAVTVRARGGAVTRIVFGARSASGKDVYARVEGLLNVFTVPMAAWEAIPANADGVRSRALVSCAREEIAGLDLHAPEAPFIRLVRAGAAWRLAAPVEAPADAAEVAALVDALAGARIVGFVLPAVASRAALAPYGLAAETGLSVNVKPAVGVPEQVVFGASAGTNLVYALVQNGTAVVTLEAAVADLFRKGDAAFRDTRVFPFGADEQVRSVSLSMGSRVYVLARGSNDVWRLEAPVVAPADSTAAAALVNAVLRIRRNDVPDRIRDEDAVRVSVATSAGVHPDVTVARDLFNDCGPFANLRAKTLLTLDATAVRRLSLKPEGAPPVAVVFDPTRGAWGLAEGSAPATVNVEAVKKLLAALTRVEAASVETLTATPDDLRRCGLETPAFTVAIDFEDANAVRRNVLLGAQAPGGGRYATVGGADAVFVLNRATTAALMVSITE